MRVVATAGHVDHGKSTLVHALTGTDPDRLAEEKARGLTIDLGFAAAELPSGAGIAFVDVPGHVRFLKNMLAGVGAVDACLFVVAATEGWKPQSEEHLRILELLGTGHGLIALTKVGLVDDDTAELARLEIEERVADTFLAGAEVVPVDAPTGRGIDELRAALDRLVAATPPADDRGRPRLWIDRSFAPKGAGTVVTGTLAGGPVAVDDELVVLPAGTPVRVRAIQSQHAGVGAIGPGHRVALNLSGVAHTALGRGDVLVRSGDWHVSSRVDASLDVLASLDHDVSRRGAWLAYLGAGEFPVKVRVLGDRPLAPGHHGLVRLHLPVPLPLVPGDRFVLRESGRDETVGGGEILDVAPVLPAARARPDRDIDRVIAERGWVRADELERLTGVHRPPDTGDWVVAPAALAAAVDAVRARVAAAGELGLDVAGLDERERAVLASLGDVAIERGRARPVAQRDPLADHPLLGALGADPFTPPDPAALGVDRAEVRELVRRGYVIEVKGICFSPAAIEAACDLLRDRFDRQPDGLTVAEIREALGTTRKYAIPLLTHLDETGRTRRRGDVRIAGPRL